MILNYKPGTSVANLQRNYQSSAEHLKQLGERADTYRFSDPDEYNSLVPIYNAELKSTKRLANRLAFQSTAADDLDLAFNRCMDPAILMSKFDKVDLTQTNQSVPPDVSVSHRLVVNPVEAETVRLIFELYLEFKTLRRVRDELDRRSIVSKRSVSKGGVCVTADSGSVVVPCITCWRTRCWRDPTQESDLSGSA